MNFKLTNYPGTLADGRRLDVPKIRPIEIAFGDRTYATEALVFGVEALMGVLPLEAMDLVVDPGRQRVVVNPEHPNYPVVHAKVFKGYGCSASTRPHADTAISHARAARLRQTRYAGKPHIQFYAGGAQ